MDPGRQTVLAAVCHAAAELTDADSAAVFAASGDGVVVVAVGGPQPRRAVGELLGADDDALAYVLAGGHSVSLAPVAPESGAASAAGAQPAMMCLPFPGDDGALGALELRARPDGAPFTVQAAVAGGLLAGVAAAELASAPREAAPAPAPEQLSAGLARLAERDPARYGAMAAALAALLAE